jgi:uncharacterized protein YndB with AHSA1/START domain
MTECADDARAGGKFRCAWRGPTGEEMAMGGVYRTLVRPSLIIRTESFEFGCAPQAGEQVATMELTQNGDTTDVRITIAYPSRDARDATIKSGMERGMAASYDRLDDLLASAVAKT